MTQDEMKDRILSLESNVNLLAEALANHAHFLHLMARQIKMMAQDMDVTIEIPRMHS